MKKVLGAKDLLMLGVGGVIGGGVFVLTGAAAHDHAGPAVVFSYVVASATSMVTGLCYTEFAVEVPVAGSAYNYVAMTFGEFAGFLCGCNLALELTISAAAVARGWTSYVATLFHASPDALRVSMGSITLDFPAATLVAAIIALLVVGMKETARFNTVVTLVSLAVVGFVIVVGGLAVEPANWTPFAPNGVSGVLAGASVVFFSFVGFDTVATCAEEVKCPGRDLPIGIMGSLGVCAALYAAMCLVITGMVPTPDIDVDAPFAIAFRDRHMAWAESVISFGAVAAITTALLSSLMGQPRVYMVMARDGLLPDWFARVHSRHGTPANATVFTGVTTAALALLVDIDILAELVSIGTLAIFGSVCAGLLARRYTPEDGTGRSPALTRVALLVGACVLFSAAYAFVHAKGAGGSGGGSNHGEGEGEGGGEGVDGPVVLCLVGLAGIVASTASFNWLPKHNAPRNGFATPFVPYLPALGVMATVQLITSLGSLAWARFFIYTVCGSVGYFGYGVAGIMRGWGPKEDGPQDTELLIVGDCDDGIGGGCGGVEEGNIEGKGETSGLLNDAGRSDEGNLAVSSAGRM